MLAAAAAAVATSSGPTVLTGDTQVAVSFKLIFEEVAVWETTDPPAKYANWVHLANDRQSYMVNFIADEGDTIVIKLKITNLAGIATVIKVMTDAVDYFDIGYSLSAITSHLDGPGLGAFGQLQNSLRYIEGEGWVLWIDAGATVFLFQHIWIKTKPPTPPGQYTILTWIEQKFQE
jgi:hypothetical protein